MSRFTNLQAASRLLTEKQMHAGIRSLAAHPSFPALIHWLEVNERAWSSAVSGQGLAAEHGKLAHAAGSLYGLQVLVGQLQSVVDKQISSAGPGPAAGGTE